MLFIPFLIAGFLPIIDIIKMDNSEKKLEEYLSPFNDEITLLAKKLREYLREETKPAYEIVGDSHQSLNIGYGFTEKAWDCYCAIIVYNNHINISFPAGSTLIDSEGILIGSGSKIRHIRIHDLNDIKQPQVMKILAEARKKAFDKVEKHKEDYEPIYTIIKEISGRKNRQQHNLIQKK